MKRSLQEYVELVVFGLIALLVGTGLLWVGGWALSLLGIVLKGLAGLLWMLLRFVVPVAIAAGLVYFLVKAAQGRQRSGAASDTSSTPVPATDASSYTPPAAGTTADTTVRVDSSGAATTDLVTDFDAAEAAVAAEVAANPDVPETVADVGIDLEAAADPATDSAADAVADANEAFDETSDSSIDDSATDLEDDENDKI